MINRTGVAPSVKESIISISKPIPKVKVQPSEPESEQPVIEQKQELDLSEESSESIIVTEPTLTRFTSTSYSGWKASDILREIRLDNFEMDNSYCSHQE
ncbi:MAG: hypothetical protein DSM106950_42225 [Stigonema ocellatum SAG 48.90 = DSM 106950]|nr:hypothetical protein [Stigonema ocellatum SAG 48.90 = DSM 106950]